METEVTKEVSKAEIISDIQAPSEIASSISEEQPVVTPEVPESSEADVTKKGLRRVSNEPPLESSEADVTYNTPPSFSNEPPLKNVLAPDDVIENDSNISSSMTTEDLETMEIMKNDKSQTDPMANEEKEETSEKLSPIKDVVKFTKKPNRVFTSLKESNRLTDPILRDNNIFSVTVANDLIEYRWPEDDSGEYYMLQEQVSTYLGITSFKRKYPEIERRKLDAQEVKYLMLKSYVNEVQVTLGLTAVRTRDVCDLMIKEYPEKYHEYTIVLDEKQKQNIKNKHLEYSGPTVEKSQMPNYLKKAMKQVSAYNIRLNRQRKEEFSAYYDMQTNVLQFPRSKVSKADPELTKPSLYPCALIPGQYQEYFQKYSNTELKYLPLNTVLYGPPAPVPTNLDLMETSGSDRDSESGESVSGDTRSEKSQTPMAKQTTTDASKVPTPKPETTTTTNESNDVPPAADVTMDESGETAAQEEEKDEPKEELEDSIMETDDLEQDPDKPICGICMKDETSNKKGELEDLISCSQCDNYGHPSCLEMSKDLVSVIVTYNWQCLECKTCTYCSKPHHEDKMMFCDRCDRGYHTFCVGLRNLPSGLWMCPTCTRSDPDFAKRGGRKRRSAGTPRKRRSSPAADVQTPEDTPSKPKRKRRTKKEMAEAREKERLEKEEKLKKRLEKKERKRKKRERAALASKEKEENEEKEQEEDEEMEQEEDEKKEITRSDDNSVNENDESLDGVSSESKQKADVVQNTDTDSKSTDEDEGTNIPSNQQIHDEEEKSPLKIVSSEEKIGSDPKEIELDHAAFDKSTQPQTIPKLVISVKDVPSENQIVSKHKEMEADHSASDKITQPQTIPKLVISKKEDKLQISPRPQPETGTTKAEYEAGPTAE